MADDYSPVPRCVAFIDILGFAQLVERSSREPESRTRVNEILRSIDLNHEALNRIGRVIESGLAHDSEIHEMVRPEFLESIRASMFSDTIVLSTPITASGMLTLFATCAGISLQILSQGMLTRGAITAGFLYQSKNIIYGTGLNEAYQLEKEIAIYPRIIVHDSIITNAVFENTDNLRAYTTNDFDGITYLDIFKMQTDFRVVTASEDDLIRCFRLAMRHAKGSGSDLKSRMKVNWFRHYFEDRPSKSSDHNMSVPRIDQEGDPRYS